MSTLAISNFTAEDKQAREKGEVKKKIQGGWIPTTK